METELRRPTFNEIILYYEIADELILLDKKIREQIGSDYSLYKGLQILLTPLIIKPKVMIIGINPGSGYFHNYKNEGLDESNPIYIIDHRPDNINPFSNRHTICTLIQSCFDETDWKSFKKKPDHDIAWSNICPIATDRANEYRKLLDLIGTGYAWRTIHRAIHRLVALIKPKLILCLGKEAFDEYCNNQFIKDLDVIEKISVAQQNIFRAESMSTHTPIVGISRIHNNLQCDKKQLHQIIHTLINK